MKKTIIITGGAGFIGSCILGKLNQNGMDRILVVDSMSEAKEKNLAGKTFLDFINKNEFIDRIQSKPSCFQDMDTVFHMGACSSTLNLDEEYLMP